MKLPKKQTSKKKIIIWASAIVILLALAGIGWYVWLRPHQSSLTNPVVNPTGPINYNPPTQQQKQQGEDIKQQGIQDQTNPPTDQTMSVTIVRTFQDPTGFNIRTQIIGATTGSCQIQLTKAGQATVTKTFPVVTDATTVNCQNTPIAISDFPAGGTWNLSVIINKDGKQSTPATTTVTINK